MMIRTGNNKAAMAPGGYVSRYHHNNDLSAHEFEEEVEQRFGSGSHAQSQAATDRFGRVRSFPSSDGTGSSSSPPRRGVLKKHSSLADGGDHERDPRSFASAIDQAREVRNQQLPLIMIMAVPYVPRSHHRTTGRSSTIRRKSGGGSEPHRAHPRRRAKFFHASISTSRPSSSVPSPLSAAYGADDWRPQARTHESTVGAGCGARCSSAGRESCGTTPLAPHWSRSPRRPDRSAVRITGTRPAAREDDRESERELKKRSWGQERVVFRPFWKSRLLSSLTALLSGRELVAWSMYV